MCSGGFDVLRERETRCSGVGWEGDVDVGDKGGCGEVDECNWYDATYSDYFANHGISGSALSKLKLT